MQITITREFVGKFGKQVFIVEGPYSRECFPKLEDAEIVAARNGAPVVRIGF